MKIDGIEVVDARKPLSLKIGKKDIGRGSVKNPYVCAAARAIMRQVPNATQAKVHMSKIYIKTGKKWTRYQAPASLRTEIVSFDRGGAFEAGEYLLAPVPSAQRYTPEKAGHYREWLAKTDNGSKLLRPKTKKRRAAHQVAGIREHAMSGCTQTPLGGLR